LSHRNIASVTASVILEHAAHDTTRPTNLPFAYSKVTRTDRWKTHGN